MKLRSNQICDNTLQSLKSHKIEIKSHIKNKKYTISNNLPIDKETHPRLVFYSISKGLITVFSTVLYF